MEAIFMGISQSRNPNLAAVFYRLGLVESYGTGVRKIMRLYQGSGQTPIFRTAEGAFTVELFNRNEKERSETGMNDNNSGAEIYSSPTDEANETVYLRAKEQGRITRKEVEEMLGCGSTKAYRILKNLSEKGMLIQQKNGNQTIYLPGNYHVSD